LYALLDDPDAVRAPLRALVSAAMASGGPPAAVERIGASVVTTPGGHAAYHDDPGAFAEAVRPLLRELSALGT
jgi:pimeloyl-ACP methyl ester carboxylesterase